MFRSLACGLIGLSLLAPPASAQIFGRRQPPPPPPSSAVPAAIPPEEWWANEEVVQEARFDPLANRRWTQNDARVRAKFDNGVDASLYRLWGLQPLQVLSLRRGEAVFETWYRPTDSSRQAVVRVIVRSDGRAFVQARAGRGCCAPDITRRVDINEELGPETRKAFLALMESPVWRQPRHVVISEGGDTVDPLCVAGASYDLTMVDIRRAVHLRRSCDPAEVGSVAEAAQTIIRAAMGRDARFDAVFAKERFDRYQQAYRDLVATGGSVKAAKGSAGVEGAQAQEQAEIAADGTEEVLAADRAFAARARAVGLAKAAQEFMDQNDSLLVRRDGDPVRGADAIYRHFRTSPAAAGTLNWAPLEAWVSETGDFGASFGRAEFVPSDASRPRSYHRYVTVWRKNPAGQWKGLIDIDTPADDAATAATAPPPPPQARAGTR
ncbi:MAG TPA: hypothetical protein VF699_06955 [Caulobacteraceae bacterium]|jgi:ketosteroid isomerase-like protein